jgi:DNA-binding GntR family transcriptional regulator
MVNRSPVGAQVYTSLREQIITLKRGPGEKIDILSTARELEVSATPVREALGRLAERGLVLSRPNLGFNVVKLGPEDVRAVFALRLVLETFALERGISRFPDPLLDELSGTMETLLETEQTYDALRSAFDTADEALHGGLIIGHCGNPFAAMLFDMLSDLIAIVKYRAAASFNTVSRLETSTSQHREILAAMKDRDLAKANRLLRAHIEASEAGCLLLNSAPASSPSQADPTQARSRSGRTAAVSGVAQKASNLQLHPQQGGAAIEGMPLGTAQQPPAASISRAHRPHGPAAQRLQGPQGGLRPSLPPQARLPQACERAPLRATARTILQREKEVRNPGGKHKRLR